MLSRIPFLKDRFSRLPLGKGSFGHQVMIMFIGTALGQLGSVISAPVLTRLYSPEMFGTLGVFTALLTIFSVIAALRYEMALPLARDEEDCMNLLAVCFTALLATTLFTVLLLCLARLTPLWAKLGALGGFCWLLPLGFLALGAYQVLVYYATQKSAFAVIARTKIYQGVSGPLTQIALGIANSGALGLIIGFVLGQSTGSTLLFKRLGLGKRESWRCVSKERMRQMAQRYIRFPLFSSWSGLINALGTNTILLVVVPALYSTTVAGFVFLTDRLIGRPLLLISTSILQVYIGDVSKSLQSDPAAIRRRFLRLAGQQLAIVAVWLLLVNAAAGPLFSVLFGTEWQAAVPYLHVLSIAYLPQMVMHALVHTLQVLERQKLSAVWESGRLLAILAAFGASFLLNLNPLEALLLYSVIQAVSQIILFWLMYRSIQSLQTTGNA